MITDLHLFFALIAIIAITCLYFIWFKLNITELSDKIMTSIIVMPLISIMASLLLIIGIQTIDGKTTKSYKPTINIASLKNDGVVSGNFTLGCGSIEQTEYYFYFYKTINGGYARGRKPVNETIIVEDDSQRPHIEVLNVSYTSRSGLIKKYADSEENDYKIIVPKGTILNKFQLHKRL